MSSSYGFGQKPLRPVLFLLVGFVLTVFGAWSTIQAQQTLQALQNHLPTAVANGQAAPVGSLPPEQNMSFSIVLPLRNPSGLTSLLGQLYDPSSPNYHHFLSVAQFTDQFGPTAEDYRAVVSFAQANGFTVTDTPANRLIVPITGSVAQINQAFNVTMRVYQHPTENRTFYSPDREPSLNLGVRVAHIAGLNNFSLPRPMLSPATSGQAIANVLGSGPGGSYLGSDMRAAYYGGTTLTGTGQAVGILEFGSYNLSDVDATFSNAGQTYNVPINNVLLDGATGAANGYDAEQVLDIVQAISMAPGLSQVRVYLGVGNDDANIFNSMATENIAKQISVSWGWVPDDPSTDDVFFEEFAAQGQTIFCASGDSGAFDAAINPYFYPGEDAYVTAVGATHLITTAAGGTWVSETAWNSGQAGSGGGISPDGIAIPSWQVGVANLSNGGSATLRNVPDVAMEGDFDNYPARLHMVAEEAGLAPALLPRAGPVSRLW
jgi:subtilase family serine protease